MPELEAETGALLVAKLADDPLGTDQVEIGATVLELAVVAGPTGVNEAVEADLLTETSVNVAVVVLRPKLVVAVLYQSLDATGITVMVVTATGAVSEVGVTEEAADQADEGL